MKRSFVILILVAMSATLPATILPSLFGGFCNTWMSADKWLLDEPEGTTGFMIGVAFEVDQGSPLIMEYGARYRTAGAELNQRENDGYGSMELDMSLSLSYIDVFGKAKYEVPFGGSLYLFPYAGYAMGLLLTADEDFTASYQGQSQSLQIDVKDDCNALNHTLLLGADLLIADRFSLGVEYNLGLSNIWSYKAKDEILLQEHGIFGYMSMSDMTTSAVMFKAGILF